MKSISAIAFAAMLSTAVGFAPVQHKAQSMTNMQASFDPLNVSENKVAHHPSKFASVAAATLIMSPLAALAEEAGDYEYGAVDAPIGLAWGAGVLAILTALLPIALRGGEDAFNEMREQDADQWGTGNTNRLNKKK